MNATNQTKDISLSESQLDLSKDSMTKEEFLSSIFGPALNINEKGITLRERIRRVLLSNYMHVIIIVLVLLDSFCVTVELIIDLESKGHDSHGLKITEEVLKYIGLSILSFFVVEIIFKILFTLKELLKSTLEIIDAIVVLISFVVDIVFLNHKNTLSAIGKKIFVKFKKVFF